MSVNTSDDDREIEVMKVKETVETKKRKKESVNNITKKKKIEVQGERDLAKGRDEIIAKKTNPPCNTTKKKKIEVQKNAVSYLHVIILLLL